MAQVSRKRSGRCEYIQEIRSPKTVTLWQCSSEIIHVDVQANYAISTLVAKGVKQL